VDGWRPRWSPDGSRIAYTERFRQSGQEVEAIAVCAADGSAVRRLSSVVVPFHNPHLAADWSPDGKRLVVPRPAASRSDLLAIDPEGDTATTVATVDGYAYDPAWSHDGSRIAYSSVTSAHPGEIHVVSTSGGAPSALTRHPGGVPAELVEFASADGVRVPGWLYTPRSPGRHPAIVWVHGGLAGGRIPERRVRQEVPVLPPPRLRGAGDELPR
jgi:dipeptidyl aminopeptidase/acylaminoacyl peptidase